MNDQNRQNCNHRDDAGLLSLILAYFFPIYIRAGKTDINTTMVSVYASRYMLRNTIAALLTFSLGEIFIRAGYPILGESVTGLFVVFAGLCGVFLIAKLDAQRKPD